jgi:hypothetical protein
MIIAAAAVAKAYGYKNFVKERLAYRLGMRKTTPRARGLDEDRQSGAQHRDRGSSKGEFAFLSQLFLLDLLAIFFAHFAH